MKPPREKSESPLSLRRITDAFAQMLGRPAAVRHATNPLPVAAAGDPCPIGPQPIVEAILFVGRPEGGSFSADELARTMRDVTPADVDVAVVELNRKYEVSGVPYRIVGSATGYRLVLGEEFLRLGHRLQGSVREARLSPQALEVLAVVAYRQPITIAEIDALREKKCGMMLAQLVRRGLVRAEQAADNPTCGKYTTTDRFLRLFGLASLSQLPQAEEFDLSAA